tara:strand:- start:95309 stop:95578 length:270 start_codon:yes stop_codon:yes gene_type:complete
MNQDCYQKNRKSRETDLEKDVSMRELYECYNKLACIIKEHGDEYLPLFERVHNEIESRKEKNRMVDIALRVAESNSKSGTHFGTQNGTH